MRTLLPALALAALACGPKAPAATETLPKLRDAIASPVSSAEQNKHNSQLVELVSEEGHLHGLSRHEVAQRIGQGDDCSKHELCAQQGFFDTDWYYEIGQPGEGYVRARPALIIGFNRFGKVERTYNLRVE